MSPTPDPRQPAWTEPRGPHLPDAATKLPRGVWPFVLLAAAVLYLRVLELLGTDLDLGAWFRVILTFVRDVGFALLGGALFLRRPDAWSRLGPIAMAFVLLAIAEVLGAAAPIVGDVVGSGSGSDTPTILTAGFVVGRAASVARLFAFGYLWAGLGGVRRHRDPAGMRVVRLAIFVAGALVVVLGTNGMIGSGVFDNEPAFVIANAVSITLSAATFLASLVLFATLLAGARAGEGPGRSWWLVVAGLLLCPIVADGALWLFNVLPTLDNGIFGMLQALLAIAGAAGTLLLLGGLLAGFPEAIPSPTGKGLTRAGAAR